MIKILHFNRLHIELILPVPEVGSRLHVVQRLTGQPGLFEQLCEPLEQRVVRLRNFFLARAAIGEEFDDGILVVAQRLQLEATLHGRHAPPADAAAQTLVARGGAARTEWARRFAACQ